MTPPTHRINAVPSQAIRDNRPHRPQVGQTAPQPIESADMAPLQLPRPTGPESFPGVMLRPDVEIAHLSRTSVWLSPPGEVTRVSETARGMEDRYLRPLRGTQPTNGPLGHQPRVTGPDRHRVLIRRCSFRVGDGGVERAVCVQGGGRGRGLVGGDGGCGFVRSRSRRGDGVGVQGRCRHDSIRLF